MTFSPIPVLDHGFVQLMDIMGNDAAVVEAARTSVAAQENLAKVSNRALLRRLMRFRHTSPFEMAELKFRVKMPIFVARQWVRHRTASIDEISGRYAPLPAEWYVPEESIVLAQSQLNKQGREGSLNPEDVKRFLTDCVLSNEETFADYRGFLLNDISRELARINLPLSTYTMMVWKIDLHNLLHFLKLRTDQHAQYEIRVYADVIESIVQQRFPLVHEAWVDFVKEAVVLPRYIAKFLEEVLTECVSVERYEALLKQNNFDRHDLEILHKLMGVA